MLFYINDRFVDSKDASIHVSDLGLLRGYGIFDFFRCIGNHPIFLEDHLDRFYHSASSMELEIIPSRQEIIEIIDELLTKNNLPVSGVRMLLTGGESTDGYSKEGSSLVITQQALHEFSSSAPVDGIKICLYEYQRMLPEIKTTNYIMGIMNNSWFKNQGADDMLFHRNGWVSELPRSNFFMVDQKGVLCTPDKHILKGITRKHILHYASTFMEVKERPVHIEELPQAKEAFLSGTGKRIIPIHTIDNTEISNRDGQITHKIMEHFYTLEKELRSQIS